MDKALAHVLLSPLGHLDWRDKSCSKKNPAPQMDGNAFFSDRGTSCLPVFREVYGHLYPHCPTSWPSGDPSCPDFREGLWCPPEACRLFFWTALVVRGVTISNTCNYDRAV